VSVFLCVFMCMCLCVWSVPQYASVCLCLYVCMSVIKYFDFHIFILGPIG